MKTQATPKTATAKKKGAAPKNSPRSKTLMSITTSGHAKDHPVASPRSPSLEDEIALMAYKIWQEQGCPEGREEQHWRQAEQVVSRDNTSAFTL